MAEKLHVFDKLYRRASNYFWTERMRRAFSFSSMYREFGPSRKPLSQDSVSDIEVDTFLILSTRTVGMSPYDSPATYNLLQYTELAQG